MVTITFAMVKTAFPSLKESSRAWIDGADIFLQEYGIRRDLDKLYAVVQASHQTNDFNALYENLNYSEDRLPAVWPEKFTRGVVKDGVVVREPLYDLCKKYARDPQALANFVYANRGGNGDEASGDGWRYRGAGLVRLTFKDNYRAAGEAIGVDLINSPELVADSRYGWRVLGNLWVQRNIGIATGRDDIKAVCKLVSNSNAGLEDCVHRLDRLKRAVGIIPATKLINLPRI